MHSSGVGMSGPITPVWIVGSATVCSNRGSGPGNGNIVPGIIAHKREATHRRSPPERAAEFCRTEAAGLILARGAGSTTASARIEYAPLAKERATRAASVCHQLQAPPENRARAFSHAGNRQTIASRRLRMVASKILPHGERVRRSRTVSL